MTVPIVIQLPPDLFVTLEKFHAEQRLPDGSETISLRTLEKMAQRRQFPGVFYKPPQCRGWWVNKLALAQLGLEFKDAAGTEEPPTAPAPPSKEGRRGRAKGGKSVASKKAEERMPAPLRLSEG